MRRVTWVVAALMVSMGCSSGTTETRPVPASPETFTGTWQSAGVIVGRPGAGATLVVTMQPASAAPRALTLVRASGG
jgi:hypothetical protein